MYTLSEHVRFSTWLELPHALQKTTTGEVFPLTENMYQTIQTVVKGLSPTAPVFSEIERHILLTLVKQGILVQAKAMETCLTEHSVYPCLYVPQLHWSITGLCNLRCKHCYVDAPSAQYGELALRSLVNILDQMTEAGVGSLSITGGEPFVRGDWREFLAEIQKRPLNISKVYTNGLLINEKFLDAFENVCTNQPHFSLSFDGIGTHDWLRGYHGAEEQTVRAIQLLRQRGYQVSVETVVFQDNLPLLLDTYTLMRELGISSWKLSHMMESSAWKPFAAKHSVQSQAHAYDFYLKLLKQFRKDAFPFNVQLGGVFCFDREEGRAHIPFARGDGTEKAFCSYLCNTPRRSPYLLPDGHLMPCMPMANTSLEQNMPNLIYTPLKEVLQPNSSFFDIANMTFNHLRARHEYTPCTECEYNSRCLGGCRALALNGGNLFGVDPDACFFWKNGWYDKFNSI